MLFLFLLIIREVDNLKDRNILIVDDEPDIRELLAEEFSFYGAQVHEGENGKWAFEQVLATPIDLIVSDIRMPGGDGVELLKKISELEKRPPLLFMTGFADIESHEAYSLGASGFLMKPFLLQLILEKGSWILKNISERWQSSVAETKTNITQELNQAIMEQTMQFALGQGGFQLTTKEAVLVNDKIAFELKLQAGEVSKFSGVGEVLWSMPVGDNEQVKVGIEILSLDLDSINFMENKLPDMGVAYIPYVEK